jgi:predicted aspartyl protease
MYFGLTICFWLVTVITFLAPVTSVDENTSAEYVSFRLTGGHDPLILVPVYVEGKGPFQFILDTGAFRCLLSPELSTVIGVKKEAQQEAMGTGGPMKMSSAHVASLTVGSVRQENVEVAVTEELSRFADAVRSKVDGVIGFSFLKDFRLTVDYQRNILNLVRTSSAPPEDANAQPAGSVPFSLASPLTSLILLPVFVNGRGPFQFVLDTGASRTTLSFELARKLGMVSVADRSATAAGGQMRMFSSSVDSLALGKVSVRDLGVSVGEFFNSLNAVSGTKLDGIIGNDFIGRFELTIDFPRRMISLTPPKNSISGKTP